MAKKIYRNPYRKSSVFTARQNKQKKSKGKNIIKKTFLLFLLILFFFSFNYALTSDYLRIKDIKILGDKSFSEIITKKTEQYLERGTFIIYKNNNYILFKTDKLENDLAEGIPEIKTIKIKKVFPDKIELKIEERQAAIGWETELSKYLIDEEGYVLKETENLNSIIYIKDTSGVEIEKNKQAVYPNFIVFIKDMAKEIKDLNLTISSIEIKETTFMIDVYIDNSFRAVFNTTKDLKDQISKLKEALSYIGENKTRLDYIDLTVKNKAIYKFK